MEMRKLTIGFILVMILIITGSRFANAERARMYLLNYASNYMIGSGGSNIYIPEGCSESDVKIITQSTENGEVDRLRIFLDDGNITNIINLTKDAKLSGASFSGSTDPSGCWHVFQHQVYDQSNLWVVSTSGPQDGLWQITQSGTTTHPDWNRITGQIIFADTSDGFLYTIDMFGKNLKKLDIQGDYPKYSASGEMIVYTGHDDYLYLLANSDIYKLVKGMGVFSPDDLAIYISHEKKMNLFDLQNVSIIDNIQGERIAPDPRFKPEFDLIERNGQIDLSDIKTDAITTLNSAHKEWISNAVHWEPNWWVWPTDHITVKTPDLANLAQQ